MKNYHLERAFENWHKLGYLIINKFCISEIFNQNIYYNYSRFLSPSLLRALIAGSTKFSRKCSVQNPMLFTYMVTL